MKTADSLLKTKNLKLTPQRVVILDYLLGRDSHPTAEDVLEGVKDKLPVCLSRATVYNTLNALVEADLVKEVYLEPGKTRYDANTHEHHHFVDTKTGQILDIPWDKVDQLCQSLGPAYKVHDYQITFYGEVNR